MTLNVRINESDAEQLRKHIRSAHPSLMNSGVDGPLPEDLDVPDDVLAAIHDANHLRPWSQHTIDDWKA